MEKRIDKERLEKELVEELKNQISESKNLEEIKKYYTKLVLAKERVRVSEEQNALENQQQLEGNDEGSKST